MTTDTKALFGQCEALFNAYPLAVESTAHGRYMTLLLLEGDSYRFAQISQSENGRYWAHSWDEGEKVTLAEILDHGVPIPRDGSLFGWNDDGTITAMLAVYTETTPERPEPHWSPMPLAGSDESQWPPFLNAHLFGPWFWGSCRAGRLVDLGPLIADTQRMAFWVPIDGPAGAGCIAVAHDLEAEGCMLPQGFYVYYQDLQAGVTLPPLSDARSRDGVIDLAPRFKVTVR